MKKWGWIVATFAIVISFQNCAPRPSGESLSGDSASGSPVKYNKFSVDSYKRLTLWDYHRAQFLDLDLDSGRMVAYENFGAVRGDSYCLNEKDADQLRNILSGAEICEPLMDPEVAGQVCTQEYTYPYATLTNEAQELKLGEKISGCDKPTDLCGEKAGQLKNWAMAIVQNLDSKVCQ